MRFASIELENPSTELEYAQVRLNRGLMTGEK